MNIKRISVIMLSGLILAGCQNMPSKQTSGAVLGGLAGGALGSQVGKGKGRDAAMIVGTLVGAALGGSIGASMDQTDTWKTQQALEQQPTGETVAWVNPDSGNQYKVTPTRTYETGAGRPCREFKTVAIIDGQREEIYGEACRKADGSWEVVK